MNITLKDARISRDSWSLAADGTFDEEIHIISGDVGSGKSTLALMMAGLYPVSGGRIVKEDISSFMVSLQFPELHVTGGTLAEECASWGARAEDILAVTGLTVKDFHLLVRLKVFNTEQMNQAVFAFRRYEDASLRYTGIESHEGLSHYGLYDTVVASE